MSRIQSGNDPVTFTAGDLIRGLFHQSPTTGINVQVKVLSMMGWNSTRSGTSTNYIQLAPATSLVTSEVDVGLYSDRGAGGLSAAVGIKFPDSLVSFFQVGAGSTTPVVTVQVRPPELTSTLTETQYIIVDVVVMVRY